MARKNGDIDWLMATDNSEGSEDYGYKALSLGKPIEFDNKKTLTQQ